MLNISNSTHSKTFVCDLFVPKLYLRCPMLFGLFQLYQYLFVIYWILKPLKWFPSSRSPLESYWWCYIIVVKKCLHHPNGQMGPLLGYFEKISFWINTLRRFKRWYLINYFILRMRWWDNYMVYNVKYVGSWYS